MIRSIVFFLDHFHLFELNLKNSLDNNFELYHLFCSFEHILSPFLNSLRTISLFFKNKLKSTQHLSIFNFSDRYRNNRFKNHIQRYRSVSSSIIIVHHCPRWTRSKNVAKNRKARKERFTKTRTYTPYRQDGGARAAPGWFHSP